jgi:glutamine synthetase
MNTPYTHPKYDSKSPHIFEYVWRDAKGKFRSKVKVTKDIVADIWNYDGSSTGQAVTENSEITLYPVRMCPDPFKQNVANSWLVLCKTSDVNDTIHEAEKVFANKSELEPMFGFEQEFFIMDALNDLPVGWELGKSKPQADFYCGTGAQNVYDLRGFMVESMEKFLYAKLDITGYNFEVAVGQAEFQVCAIGIDASFQLLLFRYILELVAESHNNTINYHSKPLGPSWNGSGMHTNFSTKEMREEPNKDVRHNLIIEAVEKLGKFHMESLKVYGEDNHLRLTGHHETSSTEKFTYGAKNRAASVRLSNYYFEDRRPAASADPCDISSSMFKFMYLM